MGRKNSESGEILVVPNRYVKMVQMIRDKKEDLKLEDIEQFFNVSENNTQGRHNSSCDSRMAKGKTNSDPYKCQIIDRTIQQNREKSREEDLRVQNKLKTRIKELHRSSIWQYST